ncbi:MAG TPA: hypothetical protein VFS30_04205 [Dehalococcoidia bacterium]|nr:hypothetical protein [Dehalococcoidia bacterium]
MEAKLEARLIELSRMSKAERLTEGSNADADVRAYLQMLDYMGSMEPPVPSQAKLSAGHTRLIASLQDSQPAPLLTRLFGRAGHAVRAMPVALTAAVILVTASSAAVITDVSGSGAAFSEVLSTLGIKKSTRMLDEPPPVLTPPSSAPARAPLESRPGVLEDEPDTPPASNPPAKTERGDAQATPGEGGNQPGQGGISPVNGNGNGAGQEGAPPGQGGENPGNAGGSGIGIGQDGTPPGQGGESPGNAGGSGIGVGQDGTPPSQGGENPGSSVGQDGTPPGQGGENPGNGQNKKP